MRDPYEVLGCRGRQRCAIKSAYRKLAKNITPKQQNDPKAGGPLLRNKSQPTRSSATRTSEEFDRGENRRRG